MAVGLVVVGMLAGCKLSPQDQQLYDMLYPPGNQQYLFQDALSRVELPRYYSAPSCGKKGCWVP